MATTITSSSTIGVSLTTPAQNPVTVAAGVVLATPLADAIYGSTAAAWSIANAGTIQNRSTSTARTITNNYAIDLQGGGTIANTTTAALISATAADAIRITGAAGTITNSGTVAVSGTLGDPIDLKAGGVVINGPSGAGAAAANALVLGGAFGIYNKGTAGVTVVNAGLIAGSNVAGIESRYAAIVTNGAYGDTTASISGGNEGLLAGRNSQITNLGTIAGTGVGGSNGTGALLQVGGATLVNGASGRTLGVITGGTTSGYGVQISGGATNASQLTNFGSISGHVGAAAYMAGVTNGGTITGSAYAVNLAGTATLTNLAGGSISATSAGVFSNGTADAVVNAGQITGSLGVIAVVSQGGGPLAITNTGTITGTSLYGVRSDTGGTVLNGPGGTTAALITGVQVGLIARYAALTASNFGTITGTIGVRFAAGGTLTNGASGSTAALVAGGTGTTGIGVYLAGTAPGLSNFGTIRGALGARVVTPGTVVNAGLIAASNLGVYLKGGGNVTNAAGGTITGRDAVVLGNAIGTLVNAGTLSGSYLGVYAQGTQDVVSNTGTILGSFQGLYIENGGTVTNGAPGNTAALISAPVGALRVIDYPGVVINFGQIAAAAANIAAVSMGAGGTLINGASGSTAGTIVNTAGGGILLEGGATTLNNFGLVQAASYGVTLVSTGSIANQGTIAASAGIGASFGTIGQVSNLAGGVLSGIAEALKFTGLATVSNAGTLLATGYGAGNAAVLLAAGGSLANSNTIAGAGGSGIIANGLAAITNSAGIAGSVYGLQLTAGGTIANGAAGTIVGRVGIATSGAAAVTIATTGTITGTGGQAISMAGTGAHRLVVSPGAVFGNGGGAGSVYVQPGVNTNTLELTTGAATGTIAGIGTLFTGFNLTTLDAGASWTLGGTDSITSLGVGAGGSLSVAASQATIAYLVNAGTVTLAPASSLILNGNSGAGSFVLAGNSRLNTTAQLIATEQVTFAGAGNVLVFHTSDLAPIAGFAATDTIDLGGVAHASTDSVSLTTGNTLQVTDAIGTFNFVLAPSDSFTGRYFHLATDSLGTGTAITVDTTAPCFASGTRIATARGPVAVEDLAVGDQALTATGGAARIAWIGHRRVDARRHRRPQDVSPVRVRAGAFAPGVPAADLRLSPDHAVHLETEDGGVLTPIRYLLNGASIVQEEVAEITYWHVELEAHGLLLAEGLSCESYLDTGNRAAFAGGGAIAAHPDFARAVWDAQGCRPLALDGPVVRAARRRLLSRAIATGHARTTDPGFAVIADGTALPATAAGDWLLFDLPAGTRTLRLASRHWIPAEHRPDSTDTRRLGVAVRALELDGVPVAPTGAGWHAAEPDVQWTDGNAVLPAASADQLAIMLVADGHYWIGKNAAHPCSTHAA